jgi:ABC-type uncharacterized transport system permease subunit
MKLYFKYAAILLKSQMQYKASFFMTMIGQFLVSFSIFLGLYFMFQRFPSVEGFTYSEVLLCFAVMLTAFSLAECFVRGFDMFSVIISNGEFDRMMVRPQNAVHIAVVTGADSKGYALVNCHNADRFKVPWDLGWSDKGITFRLIRVHY